MDNSKFSKLTKIVAWLMLGVVVVSSLTPLVSVTAHANETSISTSAQKTTESAQEADTNVDSKTNDSKASSTNEKASDSTDSNTAQANAPNKSLTDSVAKVVDTPSSEDVKLATDSESIKTAKDAANADNQLKSDTVTITVPNSETDAKSEIDSLAKDRAKALKDSRTSFTEDESLGMDSISVSLWSTMNLASHQKDGATDWVHWVKDLKAQAGFDTWSKEAQDLFMSGNVPVTAYYNTNKQFVEGKSASDGFRLLVYIYSGAYVPYMSDSQRAQVFNADGVNKFKDVQYINLDEDLVHLNKAWDLQNAKATSAEVLSELVQVKSLDSDLRKGFAKDLDGMKSEAKKATDAQASIGLFDKLLGVTQASAAVDNINNWTSGNNWTKNGSIFTYTGNSISNNTMNSAAGNGFVLAPNGKWYPSFCIASNYDSGMSSVQMAELFSADSSGDYNKFSPSHFDTLDGGVQGHRDFNNIVYSALKLAGVAGPFNSKPAANLTDNMDVLATAVNSSFFAVAGTPNGGNGAKNINFWNRNGATTQSWIANNWSQIMTIYNQSIAQPHSNQSSTKTLTLGGSMDVDTGIAWPPSGRATVPSQSSDGSYQIYKKNNNIWVKALKYTSGNSVKTTITVKGDRYQTVTGTTPIAYWSTTGTGQYRGSFIGVIDAPKGWSIDLNVKVLGETAGDLVKVGKWEHTNSDPWKPTDANHDTKMTTVDGTTELGLGNRSEAVYQVLDSNKNPLLASALKSNSITRGTRVTDTYTVGTKTISKEDAQKYVYIRPQSSTDANVNGHIRVEHLTYGTYYFKEAIAPKGYQIDNNYYKFEGSDKVTNLTSEDGVLTFGFNGAKVIGVDGEQDLWIGENGAKLHLTPIGGNVNEVAKGGSSKDKYTIGKGATVKMPDGSTLGTSGDDIVTESKSIQIDGKDVKGGFEFRGVPAGAYMFSTTDATEGYLEMTNLLVIYAPTGDGGYQFTIGTFKVDNNNGKPIYTMGDKPIASFNSKDGEVKLPTQDKWDADSGKDTTVPANRILNREVFTDLTSNFNILDAADHRTVKISTRAFDKKSNDKHVVDVKDAEVVDRIYIHDNEALPSMVHKSWKTGDHLSITAQPMLGENSTAYGEAQKFDVVYNADQKEVNPATGLETPYVDVVLKLDASKIPGKKVVMYESVKNLDDKNPETNGAINEADITNTDQTVTIDEHPSIDVEKTNKQIPEPGNGNFGDKPNNVADDHDTADDFYVVENGKTTEIYFGITNNGSENLKQVKVDDVTINGSVSVKDIVWTHADKVLNKNAAGEFINEDGSEFILNVGERILGKATLPALPAGELHGDKVTVSGVGVVSGKTVGDDDKWYGKTPLKPEISTQAQLDNKDNNTFAIGDKVNLGDKINLTGVSDGVTGKMNIKLHLVPNGDISKAKVVYETDKDVTAKGDSYEALVNKVFDTSKLNPGDYVVWTEVFDGVDKDGSKIHADHTDLKNKKQTLTPIFPPAPKYSQTGMNSSWLLVAAGVAGLVGVAVVIIRKRRV